MQVRADVGVDAGEEQPGRPDAPGAPPPARRPDVRLSPNLVSTCPVRMRRWVWGSTPGIDPDQDLLRRRPAAAVRRRSRPAARARAGCRRRCARRRPRGPCCSSASDLLLPWRTRRAGGKPARERGVQLAGGGDVQVEPLLVDQAGHGQAEEGLAGVLDLDAGVARFEGRARQARQRSRIRSSSKHVQGRAELGGQGDGVAAADLRCPAAVSGASRRSASGAEYTAGQHRRRTAARRLDSARGGPIARGPSKMLERRQPRPGAPGTARGAGAARRSRTCMATRRRTRAATERRRTARRATAEMGRAVA